MTKVLVIEDEADALANLTLMLEMEGFIVRAAGDGSTGTTLAKRELPDLILCDISMPVMDGFAVLEALRGDPTTVGIPFIFLTAKGEKRDRRAGMDLGADDYLTKPAGAEEVLSAIRARLARHRASTTAVLAKVEVQPDFTSARPLEALGLTPREAEVLLWIAQGKSNSHVAAILKCAENTVKVHLAHVFDKLGCENRNAATVRALEVLTAATVPRRPVV